MRVVVTGADGFVGKSVCAALEDNGFSINRLVRTSHGPGLERTVIPDLRLVTDWTPLLRGAYAIVHLAARAHVIHETTANPVEAFREMNVEVTRRIAETAVKTGVRRFVFVSSIGVNGVRTQGRPFSESDAPNPVEPYAQSKWECEQLLRTVGSSTGMEVVIVRPPLVYGPEAKGNLERMLKLVASGVPLPLASVANRRSLISVRNLADGLTRCVERPEAANQTFLLSEPDVHSTPEIFEALYAGFDRTSRLFLFPPSLLRGAARTVGLASTFDKLCGSLEVDGSKAMRDLVWTPRPEFHDVMAAAARSYRARKRS